MATEGRMAVAGRTAVASDAPAISPPVIETENLSKSYGSRLALAGLTMTVRRGEVFGFLGPNGAGKTTAVKLLLGLTQPSGGRGHVLGAPIGDVAARRRIGYLPELFRYQSWMTAREVLELHAGLAKLPSQSRRREIDSAVELVGLGGRADGKVGTFSKGMQQRLGLAVALLGSPDLVVLDEPTSALDPVGRLDVRSIIGALRGRGTTVFLNSHLLSEVERVCDRVAIVRQGRVLTELGMHDLLDEAGIRIRSSNLDGRTAEAIAARHGQARIDGEWLVVDAISDEAVPRLVADLVAAGAAIHAVVPVRHSLEDRFLELLGSDAGGDRSGEGREGGVAGEAAAGAESGAEGGAS